MSNEKSQLLSLRRWSIRSKQCNPKRYTRKHVDEYYDKALDAALCVIAETAQRIICTHAELDTFVVGNSRWWFTLVNGSKPNPDNYEHPKYMDVLNKLIDGWESYFNLTLVPVKVKATGGIITDW